MTTHQNQSNALALPIVAQFFDQDTNTFSYVVSDPNSAYCAVIDSVWNLDYASGTLSSQSADKIIDYIKAENLKLEWIIETHVHADHISAACYIKNILGGKIAISENISTVQKAFAKVFNEDPGFPCDGSQFDHLFKSGEHYRIGTIEAQAVYTPGHTPACMTHLIGDAAFVGDTLFMPESGTARADFPGGSAVSLYQSIKKILAFADETRLFMCHDYSVVAPELAFETSVLDQRNRNIHVNSNVSEENFVAMREARDSTLGMPRYILPSLQINMRAGRLPEPQSNGLSYLKIPINAFSKKTS
jgi:glyoxylase-like metal-dependent hydrolase (beta-lactamase superfamily II)